MELIKEEKGSIMLLLCLALTVLMGIAALAVDVGNLYSVRTRLVNTADSAALAGVALLPKNPAEAATTAKEFAQKNGVSDCQVSIENDNKKITVTVQQQVPYFFARALGFTTEMVNAIAAAQVAPLSSATGVIPFGIEKQKFVFHQLYTLKEGGGNGYSGNYGALALGGTGASNYLSNIIYGYQGTLHVGDWVSTEPGNMSGPTSTGVNSRINNSTDGSTYNNYSKNCSRVVTVPILDSLDVNGRKDVEIVGFAKFFLQGVGGQGNNNYVTGYFLEELADGEGDSTAQDFGLRSTKLIQ